MNALHRTGMARRRSSRLDSCSLGGGFTVIRTEAAELFNVETLSVQSRLDRRLFTQPTLIGGLFVGCVAPLSGDQRHHPLPDFLQTDEVRFRSVERFQCVVESHGPK